jgi:hypothetical protein
MSVINTEDNVIEILSVCLSIVILFLVYSAYQSSTRETKKLKLQIVEFSFFQYKFFFYETVLTY